MIRRDSGKFICFKSRYFVFVSTVWCLYYAIHGVLREREYELYAYIVAIIVLFCYIVVDLGVNSHRTAIKWVRLFQTYVPVGDTCVQSWRCWHNVRSLTASQKVLVLIPGQVEG